MLIQAIANEPGLKPLTFSQWLSCVQTSFPGAECGGTASVVFEASLHGHVVGTYIDSLDWFIDPRSPQDFMDVMNGVRYVLAFYEGDTLLGYAHVPKRSCKTPEFTTQDLGKAQRFESRVKAHDRAGRYNAMNQHRGRVARVQPVRKGGA